MVEIKTSATPVGLRNISEVFGEARRSIVGKIGQRGVGKLNREVVQEYFFRRSSKSNICSDIIESTSQIYVRLFDSLKSLGILLTEYSYRESILDYGCGRGGFLHYIRSRSTKVNYVGYDFDKHIINKLHKLNGDSAASFTFELPEDEFDLTTIVNVFPYSNESEFPHLIEEVVSRTKTGGHLLIVDPTPTWFWETQFNGLKLRLRSMQKVSKFLHPMGLDLVETHEIVISKIGRWKIFPISWATIWRKKNGIF
ncbi:class I SAM-dependent methyltransferase [bacterium]|nr:class I SAM-dependent methyltransferase [bacterium]